MSATATKAPYPVPLVTEIRRLRAAGWTPTEIRNLLISRKADRVPTITTIVMWTDAEYREAQMEGSRQRHRERASGHLGWPHRKSHLWKIARAQSLRTAGLSLDAIAKVLNHDHGDSFTAEQIRYVLGKGKRS